MLTSLSNDLDNVRVDLGAVYEEKTIYLISGYYINTNVNVGSAVDLTPVSNGSYCFCVISCNRGDQFTLTAQGGNNSRAWAFVDSDNNLLSKADANVTVANLKLIAPAVGSLIVNAYI